MSDFTDKYEHLTLDHYNSYHYPSHFLLKRRYYLKLFYKATFIQSNKEDLLLCLILLIFAGI